MDQFAFTTLQTSFYFTQRFRLSKLAKQHRNQLILTLESFACSVIPMLFHQSLKMVPIYDRK